MSIEVSTRVWTQSKQRGTHKLAMLSLSDHANGDGFCYPGVERIAKMCNVSDRQIQRIINDLEKSGEIFVKVGGGRNGTNTYLVAVGMSKAEIVRVLVRWFEIAPSKANDIADEILANQQRENGDTDVTFDESETVTQMSPGGDIQRENGDTDVTRTVIEPSMNLTINKKGGTDFQKAWDELRNLLVVFSPIVMERFDELWAEFPDLRRHEFALKATKENANPVSFRYYETCFLRYDPDKPKPTRDAKARKPQPKPCDVESIENVLAAQARRAAVLNESATT